MSLYRAIIPFALLLLIGCGGKKPAVAGPTSAPQMEEKWADHPLATPASPARPVKEGTPPLAYLVEADAMVRIVDLTTSVELLKMPVMAKTIVALNPDLGVQIGGATMRRGALPADHRYGIFLESSSENVSRTGYIRPGAAGQPVPWRQP